ncbi:MAG TPA: hypothetical protein VGF55_08565 [Gemmataceae bacterium]|jgi:uncharacterized membrane protein YbhN (UPF0104 family)
MDLFLEKHSNELMILILAALLLGSLLVLVPQLLRSHVRSQEQMHLEHMRALEAGQPLPRYDLRSRAAGRTAALVPMVVICAAGTVTCFLVAYKPDYLFSVAVAVWAVAGIVSLAAITGGVALLGRLAQLEAGVPDEEDEEVPSRD